MISSQQFRQIPNVIRELGFHGSRHPQSHVNPAEVVYAGIADWKIVALCCPEGI